MPKIPYHPVFYTRLITTLEEIQRYIGLAATNSEAIKDHSSILDSARSIKDLLDDSTWSPFPDYQALVKKLGLKEKWNDLRLMLVALNTPSKEYSRKDVVDTLDMMLKDLLAFSHLLNFMDFINKVINAEVKEGVHALAEWLTNFVDVMGKNNLNGKEDESIGDLKVLAEGAKVCDAKASYQQNQNCHGKTIVVDRNSASNTSSVYTELVRNFKAFTDEEFQDFIINVFSTFKRFDPAVVYKGADLYKNNIFDPRVAARKFIIAWGNGYKTLYQAFVDGLEKSRDEKDSVCVQKYNNAPRP